MDSRMFQATNFPNYNCGIAASKAAQIASDSSAGSLARYHSAPSSVLQRLLDDDIDGVDRLFVDGDGDPELLSRLLNDGIGSFASLINHHSSSDFDTAPAVEMQNNGDGGEGMQNHNGGAMQNINGVVMHSGSGLLVMHNDGATMQNSSVNMQNSFDFSDDMSFLSHRLHNSVTDADPLIISEAQASVCSVEDLLDKNMGSVINSGSSSSGNTNNFPFNNSVVTGIVQRPSSSISSQNHQHGAFGDTSMYQQQYSPMVSSSCSTDNGSSSYGGRGGGPLTTASLPPQPPKPAAGGSGSGGLIRHHSSPAHVLSTVAAEEIKRKQRRSAAAAARNNTNNLLIHSPILPSISEHGSAEDATLNDLLCSKVCAAAAIQRMPLPAGYGGSNAVSSNATTGGTSLIRHSSSPAHLLSRLAMQENNRIAKRSAKKSDRGAGSGITPAGSAPADLRQKPPLSPPYDRQPMQIDQQFNYNNINDAENVAIRSPSADTAASIANNINSSSDVNGFSNLNHNQSTAQQNNQLLFANNGGVLLWNSGVNAAPATPPLFRQSSSPAGLLSQLTLQEERSIMACRDNNHQQYRHHLHHSSNLQRDSTTVCTSTAFALSPSSTSNSSGSSADTKPPYGRPLMQHDSSEGALQCNNGQRKRSRARGVVDDADHLSPASPMLQQQQSRSPNSGGSSNSTATLQQPQRNQRLFVEEEEEEGEGDISPPPLPLMGGGATPEDLDGAAAADAILCRARAKRGHATHPRSIAERVRRTKISERIKKLQDLVPNLDKQANTADMLDEVVEYVKLLQRQIQDLSLNRPPHVCNCSVRSQ